MAKNNKSLRIYFSILIYIVISILVLYFIKIAYNKLNNNNKINITIFASSKNNINKEYFEKSKGPVGPFGKIPRTYYATVAATVGVPQLLLR